MASPKFDIDLEDCPFCGRKPEFQVSTPDNEGRCNVRVHCKNTSCYAHMINGWEINEQKAAEKWNRRVKPSRKIDEFDTPSDAWKVFWVTHDSAPDNPKFPRYVINFIRWLFESK